MTKQDKVLKEIIAEFAKQGLPVTLKEAKAVLRAERRQSDQRYKEKHGMTRQQAYMERLRQKAENGDMEAQEKLNRYIARKRQATEEWKKRNPDKAMKYRLKAILKKHIVKPQNLFENTNTVKNDENTVQEEIHTF